MKLREVPTCRRAIVFVRAYRPIQAETLFVFNSSQKCVFLDRKKSSLETAKAAIGLNGHCELLALVISRPRNYQFVSRRTAHAVPTRVHHHMHETLERDLYELKWP